MAINSNTCWGSDWNSSNGWRTANTNNGSGWNSSGDGWGTVDNDSYEFPGWGSATNSTLGAGDTPLQNDLYTDPYQENVYQVNWGDTPYTESHANPNPELEL